MTRALIVFTLAFAAAATTVGAATAADAATQSSRATPPPHATPPPRYQLTHFVCRQAQNPRHREMGVTAVMRPVPGTQHMEIKFTLLREPAGGRSFRPVRAGDLGRWLSPTNPTLGQRPNDVWTVHKPIHDLAGPAVYQLRVEFRWTDAHHRVLEHALRRTPVCRAD